MNGGPYREGVRLEARVLAKEVRNFLNDFKDPTYKGAMRGSAVTFDFGHGAGCEVIVDTGYDTFKVRVNE